MTGCRGALPWLVLAVAVAVPAAAQLDGKDIKIGIGGPLTTTSAGFGVEMKQAVELAVDERNDAGGVAGAKVVAIAIDDKADADATRGAENAEEDSGNVTGPQTTSEASD